MYSPHNRFGINKYEVGNLSPYFCLSPYFPG